MVQEGVGEGVEDLLLIESTQSGDLDLGTTKLLSGAKIIDFAVRVRRSWVLGRCCD